MTSIDNYDYCISISIEVYYKEKRGNKYKESSKKINDFFLEPDNKVEENRQMTKMAEQGEGSWN